MPTLAQMQAATPKCPRDEYVTGQGRFLCARPTTYIAERNVWRCPLTAHGDVWAGEVLGAIAHGEIDLDELDPGARHKARTARPSA